MSDSIGIPPPRPDDTAYEVRCAGLPYAGTEPLIPAARRRMVRRGRRFAAAAASSVFAVPLLLLPALLLVLLPRAAAWATVAHVLLIVYTTLYFLVLLPALLIFARRAFRFGRILHTTARFGRVRRFVGQLNWNDTTDRDLARLVQAGLIEPGTDEATIDLYPDYGLVYAIDGVPVKRWMAIDAVRAASRPEDPLELAVPASWLPEGAKVPMERRRLSSAEVSEIEGYGRILKRAIRLILLMLLLIPVLALGATSLERFGIDPRIAMLVLAVAGGLIALRHILRIRRQFRLFAEDVDLGWVIIVRPRDFSRSESPLRLDPQLAVTDLADAPMVTTEFLPVSGAVWTVDGRPAGWRRSRGGDDAGLVQ